MFKYINTAYEKYLSFKPFSEHEAWVLFRFAAIIEAIGWTLLIIGIACTHLPVSWHEVPVQMAGRIHGVFFLLYIAAVLLLSPSLQWRWLRILVAGLFSVPPYGSLLYEKASAFHLDIRKIYRLSAVILLKPGKATDTSV